MSALSEATGDQLPKVTLQLACIDKAPQEFQQELEVQSGKKTLPWRKPANLQQFWRLM